MYQILPYTQRQARRIGVEVKPSRKIDKKLDVFRGGLFIGSIGSKGMGDFPTYLRTKSKKFADERRRLYHLRHKDGPVDSPAFLSKRLLW
jgi:hypothetical protein